ncbi:hypothetical protein [Micromonospora sp. NPDC049679]
MDVQLLVVRDCPHEVPAVAVLRDALDEVGLLQLPTDYAELAAPR